MGTRVNHFKDVPAGHHFMILTFSTVHVPGDERSRTHPGHGYPAHDDPVVHYQAFTSEAEWKKAIEELANPRFGDRKDFYAAEVKPAIVTTTVSVNVRT